MPHYQYLGLTSSAYIAQRVSSAIIFIFNHKGFQGVTYIDVLEGAEEPGKAKEAFQFLGTLLEEIGILESVGKACTPATMGIITLSKVQKILRNATRSENTFQSSNIEVYEKFFFS